MSSWRRGIWRGMPGKNSEKWAMSGLCSKCISALIFERTIPVGVGSFEFVGCCGVTRWPHFKMWCGRWTCMYSKYLMYVYVCIHIHLYICMCACIYIYMCQVRELLRCACVASLQNVMQQVYDVATVSRID